MDILLCHFECRHREISNLFGDEISHCVRNDKVGAFEMTIKNSIDFIISKIKKADFCVSDHRNPPHGVLFILATGPIGIVYSALFRDHSYYGIITPYGLHLLIERSVKILPRSSVHRLHHINDANYCLRPLVVSYHRHKDTDYYPETPLFCQLLDDTDQSLSA